MTIQEIRGGLGSGQNPSDCLVDIVAIHGLYENSTETWTDPKSRIFWLRDLLLPRLPRARILTYDYEAETEASPGDGSSDRILSHAKTLIADLHADRDLSNAISRPIIFICHGLGGILVKRALAYSNTSNAKQVEHRRSIFTATYAIMFFGTPHTGMSEAALRHKAYLTPMAVLSQLSSALIEGSQTLQDINDQFAPLTKKFLVNLFWEQLKSDLGTRQGYIVTQNSADPGWETADRAGIQANHSQMCKFGDSNQAGFKLVLSACRRYIRDAPRIILARWHEDQCLIERERKQEAAELLRHDSGLSASGGPSPNRNAHYFVPRSASSLFTGGENTAKLLRPKIVSSVSGHYQHKIFVIWGLGGSGKTQFCLKFAEDNRDSFWGVFWIDATTEETAEKDFAAIGRNAKMDSSFEAGRYWLSNCQEPWLLIIDNADSHEMDVSRYFPAGGRGHIILTTRNPNNRVHATIGEANFGGMEVEDAITLLLKSADERYDDLSRRQLAKPIISALGYLAIAIIHAGATIRRRISTLEGYLKVYEKELMIHRLLPSANNFNRSVVTTYEIPLKEMRQRIDRPAADANEILQIFAFLHFQQIPITIFKMAWNNLQNTIPPRSRRTSYMTRLWSRSGQNALQRTDMVLQNMPSILYQATWDDRRLQDALAVLYDLSFISYDNDKQQTCFMHPIVHLWAQSRLSLKEQKQWLHIAVNLLSTSISIVFEPSGREFRRSLVPHITACLLAKQKQSSAAPQFLTGHTYDGVISERFAAVYSEIGNWKTSRELYEKVVSTNKKELGPEHPDTLRSMVELGEVYWNLFEVKHAIQIRTEICEIRTRILGGDNPSTLSAISDLTVTYWLAGDRIKSLYYGKIATIGLSKLLGPDDPITLTATFYLARTQLHLGHADSAKLGLEQVLKARSIFFGVRHLDTLMAMAELASVHYYLGQLAEAEKLFLEVLKFRIEMLGEEHAYTLWTINDLSKVLTDSGRATKALVMLECMLPVVQRTLGNRHVGMSMTKFNLARTFNTLGRWSDGEKVLQNMLEHVFSGHPDYIVATTELARGYLNMEKFEEAEVAYLKALDAITAIIRHGVDPKRIEQVAQQLEEIYSKTGQLAKISVLRERIKELSYQE